ncbi:carboxypeptidase-like regulatory domain-containing protein [Psychroserpens ponticola]|uniref:Carboxypeptidase-like regulatory domain-containing protein n=1 Tax=Psychroserpens ponticola TaxID=2932268 RepID=A0ABY7S2C0_9FLAO|nr:carboxypeptidase-like regulatory domain-containing protein [Psychroserpens ponticola]WCO03283.1 carboxypeptidase-like regulatory domain-containing protein [Psychroserpens ponticola]
MKSLVLSFLIVLTLFSCSKDDTKTNEGKFNITGKFLAPNGFDPISNARVSASQNNEIKSQTRTDAEGNYSLAVAKGDYTLVLNKGKFKTERTVNIENDLNLETLSVETLPSVAVITGLYDNIESVLYNIGLFNPVTGEPLFDIIDGYNGLGRVGINQHSNSHLEHGALERNSTNSLLQPNVNFHFGDLMNDQSLLDAYDIVFLNCGLSEAYIDNSSILESYVANGGLLYTTDWAVGYLDAITNSGADYLSPYTPEKSGSSTTTVATILEADLSEWLLLNYNISIDDTVLIDDFLPSWQVIDTYDSSTTISWLNGPVTYWDGMNTDISENKDLAFTFLHGEGGVFYSSFHTENHDIEEVTNVERIMQFLVFEMSDLQ